MADAIQFTVTDDDFIELTGAGVSGSVLHQGSVGSASSIIIVDSAVKPTLDAESSKRFQENPATIYLKTGEHEQYNTEGKLWAVSQSGEQLLSMTSAPAAGSSGEPAPSGLYEGIRAMTVQGYVEANVKLGVQFEASALFNIGASGTSDTVFLTGSKPVSLKGRKISYDGAGVTASIFEAPTYTGGSSAAYQNANAINPAVGESQIIVGATLSADGDLIFSPVHSLGSTSFFGGDAQISQIEAEHILQPNTAYLLRLESLDGAAQRVASHLSWYEGDLDLPRP